MKFPVFSQLAREFWVQRRLPRDSLLQQRVCEPDSSIREQLRLGPFVYPRNDLGYSENFLNMLFSVPCEPYLAPDAAARALEALLIIQADHEQNASTSAMRSVGSTRANPYACTAAAIAALWGPLHGGANEGVLQTLAEIGSGERIPGIRRRGQDKNEPHPLVGVGHGVYKSDDLRAKVLLQRCYEVLDALGQHDDPLLELAMELERVVLADDYFIERKLYPHVEFCSCLLLGSLGLPPAMFPPVFAVARTVGWVAHWNEMIADPETRLSRPRQLYTGPAARDVVPITERAERGSRSSAELLPGKSDRV